MKIGVGGCSHSSYAYGNPWHHYMGKKLNAEIITSSSSGGGNEINVQKVKYILDSHPDLDLFVLQLTEPSRFDIPIQDRSISIKENVLDTIQPNLFNGNKFYTASHDGNDKRLKELTNCDVKIDQLFKNFIYTSEFNLKYKLINTMMTIQYIANYYKKKFIFFSWFVDVKEIAKSIGYDPIIDDMIVLDGSVNDFIIKNNIKSLPRDSHYGSEAHEIIFNNFLYPQIINKI